MHCTTSPTHSLSIADNNLGFRSMPLPDEYAVRLPPPPLSQERLWRGHGGVGQGGAGLPRKPGGSHVLPLRPPWGFNAPVPPPPPLSLCIALSLRAGVCARVPGPNVPVCIVLLQACRQEIHKISSGMEHPLDSTLS